MELKLGVEFIIMFKYSIIVQSIILENITLIINHNNHSLYNHFVSIIMILIKTLCNLRVLLEKSITRNITQNDKKEKQTPKKEYGNNNKNLHQIT